VDEWDQAYVALISDGDARLLANLIKSHSPIPRRIREHLGRMLDPDTDPAKADRLVFSRTPALAGKIQTNQQRIAVGLAVLDAVAAAGRKSAGARKKAVTAAMKKFNVSASYVEHSISLAENLPPVFRDFARRNPPVWGTARKKG
jgi:hypothetical protein